MLPLYQPSAGQLWSSASQLCSVLPLASSSALPEIAIQSLLGWARNLSLNSRQGINTGVPLRTSVNQPSAPMADSAGRTLPFGLRLDKWRVPKRHQFHAQISCGSAVFKTSDSALVCRQLCEPPTLGSGAGCGTPVDQDRTSVEVATHVLVQSAEADLPVDCREVVTADAQALAPCPARRHSSVLASLTATHKLKGAADKLRGRLRSQRIPMDPSAKRANAVRVQADRDFCLDKMLACMQQPGHLFSQGFQEVDARTLAIFCQPVKVSKGDAFVEVCRPVSRLRLSPLFFLLSSSVCVGGLQRTRSAVH